MKFFRVFFFLIIFLFVLPQLYGQSSDSTLHNPWGKQGKVKDSVTSNSDSLQTDTTVVSDSTKYFEDVSLEDLLNTPVVVASKQEEPVSEAPSSVTTYTKEDMERLGYYNLGDLASITAGYSAFKTIGETSFETRGQVQSGFDNNKHLVLIDGIPVNHARANMALAEDNLNLFFAERVEFLKGPGSALYGTSAFSGVINIVPQDLKENGTKVESKFSLGNLDSKRRVMTKALFKSDEGFSRICATYFGKDATRDVLGNGLYPNLNSINRDNATDIFINASHKLSEGVLKGLGAGVVYSRKNSGMGEFWMFQQNQNYDINELTWEEIIPYLKYERLFSKKVSMLSYVKGNMSTEKAVVGGYQQIINNGAGSLVLSNYNVRVIDREWLGEVKWDPNKKTNIIWGMNVISRFSTGAPETYANYLILSPGLTFQSDSNFYRRSSTFNIYSTYLQYKYSLNFLKGTEFTLGARMDVGRVYEAADGKVINKYQKISPRICIIQKFTDRFNLKLIYGEALRAPLVKEVGLNEEVKGRVLSNPALAPHVGIIPVLKPETITSYEAVLIYNLKKFNFSGTVFYNDTKDALGAAPFAEIDNQRVYINNKGSITAHGFELETQFIPMDKWRFNLNYSRAKAKGPDGNDLGNVPTGKLNGFVTYSVKAPMPMLFTVVGRWIENYRSGVVGPFLIQNSLAANNTLMKGYHVFDVNIVAKVTKVVSLELQVRNILNSDIKTPSGILNTGLLNIPYPGRSFLGTVGFAF